MGQGVFSILLAGAPVANVGGGWSLGLVARFFDSANAPGVFLMAGSALLLLVRLLRRRRMNSHES